MGVEQWWNEYGCGAMVECIWVWSNGGMNMGVEQWWNDTNGNTRSTGIITCPTASVTLSTTNLTRAAVELNPGLQRKKTLVKPLRC